MDDFNIDELYVQTLRVKLKDAFVNSAEMKTGIPHTERAKLVTYRDARKWWPLRIYFFNCEDLTDFRIVETIEITAEQHFKLHDTLEFKHAHHRYRVACDRRANLRTTL